MLKFNSTLVFSEDSEKLAAFYTKVFEKAADFSQHGYHGWNVAGFFMIGPHDKVKGKSQHPERILLGFESEDVEKDFERIGKTGATVIAKPYHPDEASEMMLATFADPDGNYFQLASPMEM